MSIFVNYYGPSLVAHILEIPDDGPLVVVPGVTTVDLAYPGTTEIVVAGALLTEVPTEGSAVIIPESIGTDSAPKESKASKKAAEPAPATPAPETLTDSTESAAPEDSPPLFPEHTD